MKKIILLLALITWVNVSAETKYTDYEFQGYTETKLEDDELTKYEEVTFNKFYEPIEKDIVFLPTKELDGYDFVDLDTIEEQRKYSKDFLDTPSIEGMIKIKSQDNYVFRELYLNNITNYENTIDDIKFYASESTLNPTITKIDDNNLMLKYFSRQFLVDYTTLIIKYHTETEYSFNYYPKNTTGLLPVNVQVTLNPNLTVANISTTNATEFETIKNTYDLTPINDVLYYYTYTETLYKHYNVEKNYFKDSEETELEGFTYDPTESYTMYKIYKREKIEEKPTEPINPTPSDEEQTQPPKEDDEKTDENENTNQNNPSHNDEELNNPTIPDSDDKNQDSNDKPIEDNSNLTPETKPTEDETKPDKVEPDKPTQEDKPITPSPETKPTEDATKPDKVDPDKPIQEDKPSNQDTEAPTIPSEKVDETPSKSDDKNQESSTNKNDTQKPNSEANTNKLPIATQANKTNIKDNTSTPSKISKLNTTTSPITETSEAKNYSLEETSDDFKEDTEDNKTLAYNLSNNASTSDNGVECKDNKRAKVLMAIGIVLIIISIILDIVHFISVKYND